MRKSLLVSLALASVLSASAVSADDLPCCPVHRPLRADGPTNPHRPTAQFAEGIVANPRPLIQLADGPVNPHRPTQQLADGIVFAPRPLIQVADASGLKPVPRPLRTADAGYTKKPDLGLPQLADNTHVPRPLIQVADDIASGCTAVRRPLVV